MKTKTINLYSFDELSEEAKQKAIENLCDINTDYSWWDFTYDDAANIGLKITGFDINRGSYVHGKFINSAIECSAKIIQEHGATCETHKDALQFSLDYDNLVEKYSDGEDKTRVTYENESEFDMEADELEERFLNFLCEDYRIILTHEYEYLTSEDAIIETIQASEYDFTEDGELA